MCYTGKCKFENVTGDCKIKDFNKVQELTGYYPCIIGGISNCSDDEQVLNELKSKGLDKELLKKVIDNKLNQ